MNKIDEFDKFCSKFHNAFIELFGQNNPNPSMLDNLIKQANKKPRAIEIMEEKYKMTFKELCEDPTLLGNMEMNEALTIIKEALETESISDVTTLMKAPSIQRYIQFLISKSVFEEQVSDGEYQNLYLIIYILQVIYTDGNEESPVSDYDYDRLYELMKGFGTELITTPIHSGSKIVHHKYRTLRGTLAKIYVLDEKDSAANKNRESLTEWVKRCESTIEEKTGKKINLWEEEIYVFPKWDGISVVFEFDEKNNLVRAITRGNTETNEGKDVTFVFAPIVSRIRDDGMNGKAYGLKTEVMVRAQDREIYNKRFGQDYKSTRSIANSIVNTDTLDGRENLLEVVRLRTSTLDEDGNENLQELASNAFERPYLRCRLKDVEAIRKFAYKHKQIDGLNTDGAVLYIIDEKIRKLLGRKNHKNQYEIAFKFNEDVAYTKLKRIAFSLTTFGRVFPTAEFEEVIMKGNTVKNVSLGSIARFNELKLRKGDTVKILYEIVPYLVMDDNDPNCKRTNNPIIVPPTNCPECGELLEMNANQTILTCINPECPCRKRRKILNYVKKMGIREIGESTVNDLFDADLVKTIPDLYKLRDHYNSLLQLDGYDVSSVNKIIAEIEAKREGIPAAIFMGSIGIESIGKKTFEKIFSKYTVEDLLEFSEDGLVSKLIMPGIKDLQAEKILDGVAENRKLIKKLLKDYITISYPEEKKGKFIAVFHKIRSATLSKAMESLGGVVADNLTKETSFLIVPNGFGEESSSTSDKARRYGIPIVEFDNVIDYITKNYGESV